MPSHVHRFDSDRIGAPCAICGMTQAEAIADYAEDQTLSGSFLPSKSVQRRHAHQRPEPTIPLTQVEAALLACWNEAVDRCGGSGPIYAEGQRDEWIANKIKELRHG